jgi:DNA-directed RNA polymerase subunit RPC12/RpoP
MSGDVGENTFRVGRKRRFYNNETSDLRPARLKCANCGNKVLFVVKVQQLFAYPKGQVKDGYDRQLNTEHWCLNCIRGANIEDDSSKTRVSVAI